jgi:serine/threonine-protein kinase
MVFYAQHLKQRHADAIAAAATYYASQGWEGVAEALRQGYAESGYTAALRRAAEVELTKYGSAAVWDAASNYAMAGDFARALDLLERAYEGRDPNIPFIGCLPIFDPLRAEPRFQALLRKMNLPQ